MYISIIHALSTIPTEGFLMQLSEISQLKRNTEREREKERKGFGQQGTLQIIRETHQTGSNQERLDATGVRLKTPPRKQLIQLTKPTNMSVLSA
jgi:hypothetical protein